MIRFFDILLSAIGLILLSPVFLTIYIIIRASSSGPGFYSQKRIGKNGIPFRLYKFRTMRRGSDRGRLITVGGKDTRITKAGYYIRKYKLDELPQLWNVFVGEMSLVGPRPEVEKYVRLYTPSQRVVLSVRPGITDYASIEFSNENELLGKSDNPERMYVEEIMPKKIEYNLRYINNRTLKEYFKIIFLTFAKISKH
ncbi:MAG: sugar transferase [Prevotella sp.]|nr:sugar transferase [Prevotella sp.]MBP5508412.1 sugar transferase [Prevotella sp.]